MLYLVIILVSVIVGILIGYSRMYGIIERWLLYKHGLDEKRASSEIDDMLKNYKFLNKAKYQIFETRRNIYDWSISLPREWKN